MNESMYRYMKVGIILGMAYPNVLEEEKHIELAVRKIAVDDYFNAIEVGWIKTPQVRKKVKKMLDTSHMTLAYAAGQRLFSTGLNINDIDEEGRKMAVELLKDGIDEAYELGAVVFGFLSGKYEESTKEESFKALVKSTKELCEYARLKGDIKVVLGIFDYDIDKKSLIGPVNLAKRYAEEIKKEYVNFGLMIDLSHLPLLRETAEQAILPVKEFLVHAHIGNAVVKDASLEGYGDAHPRFGFPNSENDIPELVEFLRILKEVGFLNTQNPPIVSFEIKPFGDEEPDIVVSNAKRTLNEAWARL